MNRNSTLFFAIFCNVLLCFGGLSYAGEKGFVLCSYNINWANPNLTETVSIIKEINPDFLALQETNSVSKKYLKRGLKNMFPYFSFIKGKKHNADGFAFMSKHRIKNIKYVKPKFGLFGYYKCRIKINGRDIDIFSLHLMPVLPKNGASALDVLNLFLSTEETRRKEIEYIVANSKPVEPTVVMGDLNSTTLQYAPVYLSRLGYVDSFAAVNEQPDKSISWHWDYNGMKLRYRIDYIYHSEHFKTLQSEIISKGPSDHFPVVSRLVFAE